MVSCFLASCCFLASSSFIAYSSFYDSHSPPSLFGLDFLFLLLSLFMPFKETYSIFFIHLAIICREVLLFFFLASFGSIRSTLDFVRFERNWHFVIFGIETNFFASSVMEASSFFGILSKISSDWGSSELKGFNCFQLF